MAGSYNGKILHVDLTQGQTWVDTPPDSFYRTYGGGSAMGLYYILKGVPRGADPLGPDNILTFFLGVPTGLPISGQSRMTANAKSPLTGGIGDSQCGGFFPAKMKYAGYDGIVLHGAAPSPVYLWIHDGEVELRSASHLWGKVTGEAEAAIKAELGDPKVEVLQIGPAGEQRSRLAAIMNMSNRANGRTGMGAVMGSKNLKAVVVQGSGRSIKAVDPKALTALNRQGNKDIEGNADVNGLGIYGTAGVVGFQNTLGSFPTRNYTEGQFEGFEKIMGETLADTILKERDTCYACSVRCKRVVATEFNGRPVDPFYGGPEYETIATFGSYCGVDDLAAISLANQLCNMYGLDTIGTGATVAFAIECFQNELIGLEDTGGLALRYGDAEMVVTLVEQIATRTGLGALLADGSAHAAKVIGKNAADYLVTCKNAEAPAHMPQAKRSLSLIYAVNPFGADHQSSEHDPMIEEGAGELYLERLALIGVSGVQPAYSMNEAKVRFAYLSQVFYSALDSYNLCQFVWGPAWTLYGPQETADLIRYAAGWEVSVDEVMQVGERRLNMLRAFNAREGFTRAHDVLPVKFSRPLAGTGPSAGVAVDFAELEHYKDSYYALAGWDAVTGVPTPEKLAALGLEWVEL